MITLSELRSRVLWCTHSPHSDFYRKLYRTVDPPTIETWADWERLPIFSKDDLVEKQMRDYTFLPIEKVDTIHNTSGTSGKPPVFCPKLRGVFTTYRKEFYSFPGSLLSYQKFPHKMDDFLSYMGSAGRGITIDGKHIAATIRLAKAAGVDSLNVHVFQIIAIGEEMLRIGMNEDIRFIDLVGETCSQALFSFIRKTFPNATVIFSYGAHEIDIVGVPCKPLTKDTPTPRYHPQEEIYLELIDPVTKRLMPIEAGAIGELLVTTKPEHLTAFPVIRYRIGDMVRVHEKKCAAHGLWSFEVLGKVEADFLNIPGGQLRADETERVLRSLSPRVTDEFELHRYEREVADGPRIEVILHVQASPEEDMELLARDIAERLRVGPTRTYAQGVSEGIYLPLACVALTGEVVAKRKRIVRH